MKLKVNSNKSFGIIFFIFFLIISISPLYSGYNLRLWALILSVIFLILGMLNSKLLSPLNIIWFKFGLLLGKIFSPIIMGFIFFVVVTPIGLLMRLLKNDLLRLKKNSDNSYWINKTGPKSKMKNQY